MMAAAPSFTSYESYKAYVNSLNWDRYFQFADQVYDPGYSGATTIVLGEFKCPNEVYTQKTRQVLEAFMPMIIQGQNVYPLRVKLWAKDQGELIFGHTWGTWTLDFTARIEVTAHGSPLPAWALVTLATLAFGAIVAITIGITRLADYIGHIVSPISQGLGEIGSGLGEIMQEIGENILPFSLIAGGAILGGIYLSRKYPEQEEVSYER